MTSNQLHSFALPVKTLYVSLPVKTIVNDRRQTNPHTTRAHAQHGLYLENALENAINNTPNTNQNDDNNHTKQSPQHQPHKRQPKPTKQALKTINFGLDQR
jgi:hypothetical protein